MSVCLSARISPEPQSRSLPNFSCMLPMSLAQSSGMLTIGCIACQREGVMEVHSAAKCNLRLPCFVNSNEVRSNLSSRDHRPVLNGLFTR